MEYARSWSVAEPYVLRPQEQEADDEQPGVGAWRGPSLPLEAVEDGAGAVIRLKTPEIARFFAALSTALARGKCEFVQMEG